MGLLTTCIGAYPKPHYIALPDWFNRAAGPETAEPTRQWSSALEALGAERDALLTRGVHEAVHDQVEAGIDIPTDGEIARENYIHYQSRHWHGIDFDTLTEKTLRAGSYRAALPTIVGPVSSRGAFIYKDWQRAQSACEQPVKITLPGPMTLADTHTDRHYNDPQRLGEACADALNIEIIALAEAGCQHIQMDEPVFARYPEQALHYGFEHLERAFAQCPPSVTRTLHMCCGYPDRLDHPDYPKADPAVYPRLLDAVEASSINAVSIEDAHCHSDLGMLERLSSTIAILGVVQIASTELETVAAIETRLREATQHIEPSRLWAAPDCGLGMLDRTLARKKLKQLCLAAQRIPA